MTEEERPLEYQVFALSLKEPGAISYFAENLSTEVVGTAHLGLHQFYCALVDFYHKTGLDPIDPIVLRSWLETETEIYESLGGALPVSIFLENILDLELSTPEQVTAIFVYRAKKRRQLESLQELQLLISKKEIKNPGDNARISYLTDQIRSLEQDIGYNPLARIDTGTAIATRAEGLWELPDFLCTPFLSLNRALGYTSKGGFVKGATYAILARSGLGKPVDENARITMGDGQWKILKEVKVGDYVITHKGRPRKVLAVFEQGLLPSLTIKTNQGRSLTCALDHPILTDQGWKEAQDLTVADRVYSFMSYNYEPSTEDMTKEEAALLGYFIGDGCTANKNIACWDHKYQAPHMQTCAETLGLEIILQNRKTGRYDFRALKAGRLIKESYPDKRNLSFREREILTLLCVGYSRKEIGQLFGFTNPSSISSYITNIRVKMEITAERTVNQSYDFVPNLVEKAVSENIDAKEFADTVIYYSDRTNIRLWLEKYGVYREGSHTKLIPPEIFTASLDVIANFIAGYFATDGTATAAWRIERAPNKYKSGKISYELSFSSVNRQLLEQVQHLLLRFGFDTRLELKNGIYKKERHTSWRLRVCGGYSEGIRFLNTFPLHTVKSLNLEKLIDRYPEGNQLPLPSWGLLPDNIVEITSTESRCMCLMVEDDLTFIANDLVVHNSTLAKCFMNYWVENGHTVLFVNYEEAVAHWERTLFSQVTKQNVYKAEDMSPGRKAYLTNLFQDTMNGWGDKFMVRHDPDTPFFEDLEKWLRDIIGHGENVPDVVIIDTIQSMLIKGAGGKPRWGQFEEMMVSLEKLAKDLNCVLILTAQENNNRLKDRREVVNQSDVGGSVTIAQKATATIFITEKKLITGDDSEDERIMQLQIPKNRITGTTFMSDPPLVKYIDDWKSYIEVDIPEADLYQVRDELVFDC